MEPFTKHMGIIATLNRANVDTDAIIPKQFLKSIRRTGYGPNAFFDWRYTPDGELDVDFELNQARFAGRSILVTRNNFGCGSSREHAVWALEQDGFRVIVAPRKTIDGKHLPGFADIFRINASKNGVLTIELSEDDVDEIFALVGTQSGLKAEADLEGQQIVFHGPTPKTYRFEMDAAAKEQMIKGLDDIDQTLQYAADITRFEATHDTLLPQGHI